MPKAKRPDSTPTPDDPDFAAAIAQLRELVDRSGDALLLATGPVTPDYELLGICANAIEWRKRLENARGSYGVFSAAKHEACRVEGRSYTDAERAETWRHMDEIEACEKPLRRALFQARKIPATTPAGIYAKAMIVRTSKTAAALLSMSLADDLIACQGLRASLWPASGAAEG